MSRDSTLFTSTAVGPGPVLPAMFARYRDWVEDELAASVPVPEGVDPYVLLRYHLGWVDRHGTPAESPISQGKALRPTLCLFACEALADDPAPAVPAAAALELIHNFSLIHDDIQDQDKERRHQPSVWAIWGVPKALVAGNAMQAVGDATMLNTVNHQVPAETVIRVSQLLTESYLEMIQGQCLDLTFESSTAVSADDYLEMISYKTGALIRTGMEIGALLAAGDSNSVESFSRFGSYLGRAFQIRDDFLGIWGDSHFTGKPEVSDIRRRKKSFPVVFAFSQTRGVAHDELLRIYSQEALDDDDVGRVLTILEDVGAREQSQLLTEASAEGALEALESVSLPDWARSEAEALVEFLAQRQY